MKSVIEDIFELRKEKLLRKLKNIDASTPIKLLSYSGSCELNCLRPAFSSAYSVTNKMQNIIKMTSENRPIDQE